jgi:release factor glutamine methyltransferase
LNDNETTRYREYISRRGKFEPLQYIIGKVEFYGEEFIVNPNVLIPRQETEILVETIINNCEKENKIRILEVGTGCGIIPIILGKYLSQTKITSVDVNTEAIKLANLNAEKNCVEKKICFLRKDILVDDEVESLEKYDLIVSNPPYVGKEEYEKLQKEIRIYEPAQAVTDLNDGYKFYKRICSISKLLLNTKGKLFFEVGEGQAYNVKEIMEKNNFKNIMIKKDYLNIERVVYGELI